MFCFSLVDTVVSCTDPGKVEHSRRVLSGPHLTAGSTIQYVCNKGFVLSGNSLLTCFNRGPSGPKWNQKLPRCLRTYSPEPRFPPTHRFPKTYLQIPGEACMCEDKQTPPSSFPLLPSKPQGIMSGLRETGRGYNKHTAVIENSA